MFTVPESARWLTKKGRHDEAWKSLTWIRADDSEATVREMEEIRAGVDDEIRAGVDDEIRATEGFQFKGEGIPLPGDYSTGIF